MGKIALSSFLSLSHSVSRHGNPRDPVKLNSVALVKFCRDIMVLDFSMTERPILAADVHLLFTAEIKRNQLNVSCFILSEVHLFIRIKV